MSRTLTNASYTMTYPNATHFAFVPAIVRLTSIPSTVTSATLSINCPATSQTFVETREAFANQITFNIYRFLQVAFDNANHSLIDYTKDIADNPLKRTVNINITMANGASVVIIPQITIDAIWGTIARGESSGGIMRRKWFTHYPFTLDVFTKNGDTFDVSVDGELSKGVEFYNHEANASGATAFRRALINPSKIFDVTTVKKSIHIGLPHGIVLKNDTETIGLTAYTLDIDRTNDDKHVYLRWIDSQGRYCYYLFKDLGATTAVTMTSWNKSELNMPTEYIDGVNVEGDTRQSFASQRSRTLGVKLCDAETFEFLLGAAHSPIVDVFDGYDNSNSPIWHRVNVAAGNYARTTKTLQDYQMTIVEPQQRTQIL